MKLCLVHILLASDLSQSRRGRSLFLLFFFFVLFFFCFALVSSIFLDLYIVITNEFLADEFLTTPHFSVKHAHVLILVRYWHFHLLQGYNNWWSDWYVFPDITHLYLVCIRYALLFHCKYAPNICSHKHTCNCLWRKCIWMYDSRLRHAFIVI